jgi:hypothetical protein
LNSEQIALALCSDGHFYPCHTEPGRSAPELVNVRLYAGPPTRLSHCRTGGKLFIASASGAPNYAAQISVTSQNLTQALRFWYKRKEAVSRVRANHLRLPGVFCIQSKALSLSFFSPSRMSQSSFTHSYMAPVAPIFTASSSAGVHSAISGNIRAPKSGSPFGLQVHDSG